MSRPLRPSLLFAALRHILTLNFLAFSFPHLGIDWWLAEENL
jgi:hypothetical protein